MAKKIQETGPLTYRQLQKMNADPNSIASSEDVQRAGGVNWGREAARRNKLIDAQVNDMPVQSPVFTNSGGTDYYGRSMFDPDVVIGQTVADQGDTTITDTRAENQPWYAKLGAGIGKGIVLAGTTFLDGTVGLLSGIGTAISEGRWSGLFDNVVSNGLNEVNRQIEDILPNYRTQEEQERPWYENLGTVNFWADSFLKNLGFTVGAFYSGGLFTKALKGVKWLNSGLGAALTGSIFSAVNEGRVEANNTMHDLLELHTQQLRDAYNKRYSEIVNSSLSNIDKQKALAELDANFDKEDAKNLDNARLAGDIDLLGNTILLSLDNFNTYGRLFARGFKNAEKTAQNSLRTAARHADEKLSSRIIRNADGSYDFEKYGAKDLVKSGLKTATLEGNEEMAQQFLSNFSGNVRSYDSPDAYYNALLDSNAEQKTMDFTKSLTKAFADSYGDGQQWEQFAVGALTGILGVPTFGRVNNSDSNTYLGRGKAIGLSGGIFGEMGQNREANQRGQEIANRMNSFAQKLKDHQRYFTQSQSFTDAMDGFAKDGNAYEFKNAEDNEAFSAMSAFAQAGRLDDYKQMVNADFDNMSDEDLDAIAKMTSQNTDDDSSAKDQGWRNADGTYMSETEEGRQQMRYELKKKRDKILSQIDAYTDSLDRVRGIGNNSLTDDQVNELAWLDWKVGQFNDRLKQVTSEANAPFKSIKEGVDYMIQALEKEHDSIIADGDEDKKDENGNNILKENEKQQAKYKNISNVLTQLINSDLRGLASIKPDDFNEAINEMNSTKFFNDFNAYSNVTATDYGDALKSVVDTFKLLGARNEFNKRLKEFTEDPLKLIQNRQKIDKKKAKTEKVKHAVKTKDKVDNASVSDIVSQLESGDITDDDLGNLLNEVGASLAGEDDSISDTKGKINAAKDIIESSHRAEDKLDNLADDSDVEGLAEEVQQAVQDAKSLLAASKSKANSKDELFDTESEAWNNPNNLPITDEVQQALSEMSPEEQDDFLQGRIDRAKNAMEKVKSFIYDEDKESSKMPNTEEQAKNKKAAEESEKKRREDGKEASGVVASSDSDSPGASVTKVNLGGEQPKESNTTANLSARELLKDVALPNGTAEDTYNAVDNILKGVDYAWKRGLRGKDLHDAITSTESWNKVIQAVPDLGDRINSYISNKYNIKPKAKTTAETETNNDEETSEVRTPASDPNENANVVKGQWDAKPEKVEYGYWKPTTTEIGIHDDASDSHPFYKTAQVINSVFDKNFKDLDPYEQFVYDNYIKPGYIRHKYDAKQLQSMKAVYEYLEKHSAFDNVNKGFVKKDTTIYFTIDNTLNRDAGEIIVLMTLKDGTVVGDLSGKNADSIINEYKSKYKEEDKRPDTWTSETTTTVRQMMRGKVPYSVDTNNVNKVFEGNDDNGDSFKLGISMGIGNNAPIFASAGRTKMQGSSKLEQTIVSPLNAVLGQPYILLPTAGKTQRMCVPFNMKRFTKETADSQLGKAIKSVISAIPNGTDKDNAMSVKTGLEELLAAEFHVNYDKDNNGVDTVKITRKMSYDNHQETIYNGPIANENLVQNIVDALCKDGGTPFEVSRKYVNSKYNLNGTPISYNKMIGEVSDVNLPLGTTSTINDWFILNPPNGKASRVTSTGNNTKQTTAGSIRTVSVNGVGNVQVNTNPESSWRIVSHDNPNTPLTEIQESIARAIAYGETNPLVDNTKPYKTRWGVFDPNTQKFLTSENKGGVAVKHFSLSPEEETTTTPSAPTNTGQKASFTDEQEKQFTNLLDPYYEGGGASIENDLFNGKELPKDVDDELGAHAFTSATPSITTVNWVLANIDPSIREKYLSSFASFNQGNEPKVVTTKEQSEGVQLLNTKWVKIDGSGHFILDPSVTIDDLKKLSDFDKYFTIVSSEAPLQESTGFDIINSGDLSKPDDKGNRRVMRKAQIALRGKNNEDASAAKKIGDKIVSDSKNVQLTTDKKYYVGGDGTKYARVTSIIQADVEGEVFDENSPWITPSTNIGTGLDELGRDFMAGRTVFNTTTNAYEVNGVPVEDVYPNINRDSAKSYLDQWTKLKSALDKRGIHIIPREVVAKGQLNIKDKEGKDHTINVAGTLDLLGYDDEGKWYIFDMKTHRSDITDSKKSKWSRQLSLYKKFLEDEYGIKVSVLAIIPTKVNYPAPTDTNIYGVDTNKPSLYNGVESNQLTLHGNPYKESNPVMGRMIVLTETTPNIQLDKLSDSEKAILSDYDSTKVNYQPKGHKVHANPEEEAKKKGLTVAPRNVPVWESLSPEQQIALLDMGKLKANTTMNKLAGAYYSKAKPEGALFDEKRLGGSVDEFLGVSKNRLVTTEKYTPWKPEKELGWLRKALPQFSDDEHLKRITEGFIKLDGKREAYGRFKQGIIELSDIAARGTVYHEAFHAVFNTLLDNDEQTDVMNAARAKYGDLGSIQLEENLAEDFRRYIQWEQTPVIGTLVKAFRTIKHIVFGLLNKNNVLDKLYYNIDRGRFANKVAGTTNADRPRLYASDVNDSIHKLDSDYRRGKQLEGTISANMKSVIDKFIKDHDLKDVAYAVKYNNSDKWVMRVTKKNYNEKRNFLVNRLNSIYNSELSSDERNSEKALLEQEEREDEQFNRAIEQWHRDKLMYGNLSEDDKLYLQERGISIDEYNEMSPFEKEILFRCKY